MPIVMILSPENRFLNKINGIVLDEQIKHGQYLKNYKNHFTYLTFGTVN